MMDLGNTDYFQICKKTWNFFKGNLPVQKDQRYWNEVMYKGEQITNSYKDTQYYTFVVEQVTSYINELDRLSKTHVLD